MPATIKITVRSHASSTESSQLRNEESFLNIPWTCNRVVGSGSTFCLILWSDWRTPFLFHNLGPGRLLAASNALEESGIRKGSLLSLFREKGVPRWDFASFPTLSAPHEILLRRRWASPPSQGSSEGSPFFLPRHFLHSISSSTH